MSCLAPFALLLTLPTTPVAGPWRLDKLPYPPQGNGLCWCVGPSYYRIYAGDLVEEAIAWEIEDGPEPRCGRRLRPTNLDMQ